MGNKKLTSATLALVITCSLSASAWADDSTTSSTVQEATTSNNLVLKAAIEGNYKVVGSFNPLTDKSVQLYKITVTNSWSVFTFTVGADKAGFTDWHARVGVNTYTIAAVLQDGSVVDGNSVKIVMGPNGEVTTEDALSSMKQTMEQTGSGMRQEIKAAREDMKQKIDENRQTIQTNRQDYSLRLDVIKDFLKTPLTDDEKAALKELSKKQQADRDVIIKDSTLSLDDKQAKMKALVSSHVESLLPYISSDKIDSFKKFAEEKLQAVTTNQELRKENKELRQDFKNDTQVKREELRNQVKAKVSTLSLKLRSALIQALDKIPTEKRIAVYNKILENITNVVAKVQANTAFTEEKKNRLLAQLKEIASIVQDRVDALSGTGETSILNDILSETNTQQ